MADISTLKALNSGTDSLALKSQAEIEQVKASGKQDVKSEKQADKAASGFEALLLQQMFKSMWSTVNKTDLMGENSNQAEIFQDMFQQAVADTTAKGRGIGVKKMVRAEIVRRGGASK